MPVKKIYTCCICHKVLDSKPHRLVHQEWEDRGYGLYRNTHNFDFCDECFKIFTTWVDKNSKKVKR